MIASRTSGIGMAVVRSLPLCLLGPSVGEMSDRESRRGKVIYVLASLPFPQAGNTGRNGNEQEVKVTGK